ncbi:MmpS family transport accessory protein [Mycolicibacterium sp. 120270]|uniref:MmpS family transport accessory protein n=1 Tax=Mycolicibacterium sp. 120270 TaxID=3090600 RepID=UPI00299DCE6A|nr:MmpS family transport accessory protein [Mycolicibacterium sp. 120270]MDX1884024.1 MmpS family transport accessory protein [Mycolicibacterium sp. 120270]
MNRPSSPWMTSGVTERIHDRSPYDDEYADVEDYDSYADYDHDGFTDLEDYDDVRFYTEQDDRKWLWVASVAGIVLLIAVAGTMMILSGGDSGTTSATVSSETSKAAPYPSEAPTPSASRRPSALPPETITSVTPTPTATAAPPSATAEPTEAAPPPAAGPHTVTYTVTGSRQLFDLVTIIYTDEQGALQTAVNVALPWTKQVTLNPGVELSSVTATSVAGQLNCSITDGTGATLAAQNSNTIIANCTR